MWKFVRSISRRCRSAVTYSFRQFETDISATTVSELQPTRPPLPLITSRNLQYKPRYTIPRQAWLCNMDTVEEEKLGIVDLHPQVFAAMPRFDIIFHNLNWQKRLHYIDFQTELSRAEMRGGGRKPWPQKGTGRARHGSIRSPIFKKGGKAHGKRGPHTDFFMLPHNLRVRGLTTMLSCKHAQDDLVIVDSLEIPSKDQKFMEDLIETRQWGKSVLFINDLDIMPVNITLATDKIETVALMPYYGLNVFSMLKYETLVITLESLNKIEDRLLFNLNRADGPKGKFELKYADTSVLKNST
ncbi:hypothetical protein JTE90_028109 [Oedothorax gibbosus]|uniref:Large ribosomal subunit protein uL4m n=1 Tax=Oedothorax gibbosus TaxID=931172 RepID=A0AAV6V8I8_9ARAC|nr:hypothetical protein JTE90_028109 [Oedothorax gibbosus]